MKRIRDEEEVQEGEIVQTHWDLRKIAVGLVVLIVLFIAGAYTLKLIGTTLIPANKQVLGVTDRPKEVPPLPDRQDVENIINNAKQTLSEITSDNLNASGGAIQKLIKDLESLQGKKGALGLFCSLACKDK